MKKVLVLILSKFLIACLLLFVSSPDAANSEDMNGSGNGLLEICSSVENVDLSRCMNFLVDWNTGFEVAAARAASLMYPNPEIVPSYDEWIASLDKFRGFCVPEDVTVNQIRLVVLQFLNKNPNRLHEKRGNLVLSALQSGFPCN